MSRSRFDAPFAEAAAGDCVAARPAPPRTDGAQVVSRRGARLAAAPPPSPRGAGVPDSNSRFDVPFAEELSPPGKARRASHFQLAPTPPFRMPYRLYVDNETLVEPIHDLRTLRRGDHCMVGLNPVRKVSRLIDSTFVWLSSWEVWPLFHHFVMYDDVVEIDGDGVPMGPDGTPALICEYSNTPAAAFKQMRQQGVSHLWRNLAPFRKLPLHDYQDARHAHGLLRIVRHSSDAERDEVISRLDVLLAQHESYSLWFRNCEHAAFAATLSRINSDCNLRGGADGGDAGCARTSPMPRSSTPFWVSLQVPHVLFTLARFKLQLVGTYCLYRLSLFASDMALVFPWLDEAYHVKRDVAVYHLFATAPVALQIAIQLGRAVRNLVRKRRRGKLHPEMFSHLLGKEIARAVIVGFGSTTTLVVLPRLMHDLKLTVWSACTLLVFAFMSSSLAYTLLASAGIRLLLRVKKSRAFGPHDWRAELQPQSPVATAALRLPAATASRFN
ncbi:hypothetical protein KFE25_002551 [Diacronema lutheri]|uniref:LRAT domain-containing protein n=1 Tax=Diacronema lutheri TaxID=2081491 RepID=A0A8J6C3A1_DIALT|nr:hypothetical protein KFE25_002551 [Diacronema lutheri]